MQIDIWSDVVCPFCYIGKRTLALALEQLPDGDQVQIRYRSFELQPQQVSDPDISVHEMLAKKYGMSAEQAKQMSAQVADHAARVGLTFNFEPVKQTNTHDLHRLAKWAETHGKADALHERLFRAYFCDGKFLGNKDTVADIAGEAGLPAAEASGLLSGDGFRDEVLADQRQARELGISGVPFFLINQKYAISGAQPVSSFVQALSKILQEEQVNA